MEVVLCFRKKNSNPPICGIHGIALIENQLPIDPNAPQLGYIIGYVCPVTQQVVTDTAAH
jgi:hypothetical protein